MFLYTDGHTERTLRQAYVQHVCYRRTHGMTERVLVKTHKETHTHTHSHTHTHTPTHTHTRTRKALWMLSNVVGRHQSDLQSLDRNVQKCTSKGI